jgi:DNA-binding MarR family transcriptional regulator
MNNHLSGANIKQKAKARGVRRPAVLAWLHLLRISHRVLQAATDQLAPWGLSNAQFDVLANVGASEGISQLALARRLSVTQGNVTQLLAKMESQGLIQRVIEGRSKRLYLTPTGQTLFAEVVPIHEDFIADQVSVLSPDEQRELMRLLAKLDRAQRRMP